MDPSALLDALRTTRPGGMRIRDWSVYVTDVRRLSLGVKDVQAGNPHAPLTVSQSAGAQYLLVWQDGRISRGYLERRDLEADPVNALEQALPTAYDDPDAAHVAGPGAIPEVPLYDARVAQISRGDPAEIGDRLSTIRECMAEGGFRTWSASFSAAEGQSRLVTSAALDVTGRETSAGWHASIEGEIGDGFVARNLDSNEEFTARLRRLTRWASALQREAEPMSGGLHRVLLHPRVVESFVLNTLLANLDGATVAHGEGHFRLEQFGSGDPVLRDDLGLRLDPLLPLRYGSYRSTREGVAAAPCAYIEGGRLITPLLSLKYARRVGLPPTPLPYSKDTLFFEGAAPLPLERALEHARGGALLLSVLGVHTQDTASGDFSLSSPQVLRVGTGGFCGRLKATISGNLFELLRGEAWAPVVFDGEHTPGLLVDCRLDPK